MTEPADLLEVEDKYDVDDGLALPPLDGSTGVAGVAEVRTDPPVELRATYFDLDDLTLLRAGVTLRRRTGGADEGWHAKLPTGDGKYEVHVPLDPGATAETAETAEQVPDRLAVVVGGLTRRRPLVRVAVIGTRRTVHRLLDETGRVLATVSDDAVSGSRLVGADGADGADGTSSVSLWREWEVELVDGDRDLLAAVGERLRQAGATPAQVGSKLGRTLGDRFPAPAQVAPRRAAAPQDPASVVVDGVLADLVAELRMRDPLARADAPDGVHKMRVAARRLRSVLASYRPLFDRSTVIRLRGELRWLGEVLGAPRDAEVMRERLLDLLAELSERSPLAVRGAVVDLVGRELDVRHARAHRELLEQLPLRRYDDLVDLLTRTVAAPPYTEKASEPVDVVLRKRVRKEWSRVESRMEAVAAAPAGGERDLHLHEARKAAKRLRYAAEPLAPVYGRDARRFVKRVKKLQTVLGEHHDSVVARTELVRLADLTASAGENAFTFGALYAEEDARGRQLEKAAAKAWKAASKSRLRDWLG